MARGLARKGTTAPRRYQTLDTKALLSQLSSHSVTRFGVRMLHDKRTGRWKLQDVGGVDYASKRECLQSYFSSYGRKYCRGFFTLRSYMARRSEKMGQKFAWRLCLTKDDSVITVWQVRPNRADLAEAIKRWRRNDSRPSYKRPDTLGWRTFDWHPNKRCMQSGVQGTLWLDPEMRTEDWSESSAVRGTSGIHACRLPKGDWRKANKPGDMPQGPILGLVERFGKFVLGSEGWRAEWVLVKELLCADAALARQVKAAYPDIPVGVAHEGHWMRQGGK